MDNCFQLYYPFECFVLYKYCVFWGLCGCIKTESHFIMCASGAVTCLFYCLRLTIPKLLYLFVVTNIWRIASIHPYNYLRSNHNIGWWAFCCLMMIKIQKFIANEIWLNCSINKYIHANRFVIFWISDIIVTHKLEENWLFVWYIQCIGLQ